MTTKYRINWRVVKTGTTGQEERLFDIHRLAQRKADNLYQKLGEVNAEKKLVRRLPSRGQVGDWVAQAKALAGLSPTKLGRSGSRNQLVSPRVARLLAVAPEHLFSASVFFSDNPFLKCFHSKCNGSTC